MNKIQTALILGAAALLAPTSDAQTYSTLIKDGDVIMNGATLVGNVSSIGNVDVNNSGSYLLEVDTDNPVTLEDNVIIHDGVVIYQEGVSVIPSTPVGGVYDSYVDSMDINDNGDILLHFNVDMVPAGGTADKKIILWNGINILEQDVTPTTLPTLPPGTNWAYINEVWQNNGSNIVVYGSYSHDTSISYLTKYDIDALGNLSNETVIRQTGELLPGHLSVVTSFGNSKTTMCINDAGDMLYPVDDDHQTGSGGSTVDDTSLWFNNTEIPEMREGQPTLWGGYVYGAYYQSCEFDLNASGDWCANILGEIYTADDSGLFVYNAGTDTYTVIHQEGDQAPGFPAGILTGSFYQNRLSDTGDIMWSCDTHDPDTSQDRVMYYNGAMIFREGHTMVGADLVEDMDSGKDSNAMSNNGVYIIQEGEYSGNIDMVVLIEMTPPSTPFCFGDGSDGVNCPCGNVPASGSGEGCTNGTGVGAYISTGGAASVSADTLTLTVNQSAPNEIGIFVQNISTSAATPFYNGAICLTNDSHLVRHYAPPTILPTTTDATGMGSNMSPMTMGDFLNDTQPGVTVYYQYWGRDTGSCGNGANFSSGVSLTWNP